MSSLFSFVLKTVIGAFSSCSRPFSKSEDSTSDDDSDEEASAQKVITELPRKKVNIRNISKDSSLSDVWSYIDNGRKDVNKSDKRLEIENSYSYKQKKNLVFGAIWEFTDSPKYFRDLSLSDLNGCISLKILRQEDDIFVINEFEILVKEIRKNFRIIKEIIPSNEDVFKRVPYSAKACIILFRYYFDEMFYINNAVTAFETSILAQDIQARKLLDECYAILPPYSANNQNYAISASHCFIGFSNLSSPDICFPLNRIQLGLNEAFKKDIINTAEIQSESGLYLLSGVELCFDIESESKTSTVTVFYAVSGDSYSFENEVQVRLAPLVSLSFEQDYAKMTGIRRENQNIKLSITVQDIKPRLCFCSLGTQYVQKTLHEEFLVNLSSSRKTETNISLFYLKRIYIENLLE